MNEKAMHRLSYGLFVVTARDGRKENGCIINTAIQAASEPKQMGICINKTSLTHDMIRDTGAFTVSVLSQDAPFALFKRFGFQSGREADKFADFSGYKRGKNGISMITEGTNAFFEVEVTIINNLVSHSMFIGNITEMDVLSETPSVSYEYYRDYIKPEQNMCYNMDVEKE